MAIEIQAKNPVIRLGVPGPQSNVQPDWSQQDSTAKDYIKNKVGYREIFTKQTGVCTIENIEPNTLYLVQDLSMEDEDTLSIIRNNMRYSNAGNRFCTIVPQLDFWTYMPYFGHEAKLSTNFNKNHFTQYDTSDEYNYYLTNEYNRFYIILDRTKLSSQNAETFPKDGIYFKTTNANTNRVSTAIYSYHRIDTLYLSSSVATTEELNTKQDTLIQSGASVGQIAKITAVDSSGKPTAWQAVDMPSGGGTAEEYELIFTDTITEDTAGYFRDTDANGNTFALKKAILIVFTPPYEESDTSYGRGVGFLPTTKWGHDCISNLRDSIKSSNGGTGNYDVIFAEIIMGYQMCTARFESQNMTNVFSVMQPVTRAGATGLQFVGDATKLMQFSNPTGNMTCVKIVGYASPIIAKNTQIKLYGVRA